MRRPFVLITLLGLLGCQTAPPTTDPFLKTTVPPPGTGAATTTADPYYPTSGSSGHATPAVTPASAPVVTPASKFAPPGGSFNYQQSSIERPRAGAAGMRRSSTDTGGTAPADAKPETLALAASAPLSAAAIPVASAAASPALATAKMPVTTPVSDDDSHVVRASATESEESPITVASFREVPSAASAAVPAAHNERVEESATSVSENQASSSRDEGSVIRILEPTGQRNTLSTTQRSQWSERAAEPVSADAPQNELKLSVRESVPEIATLPKKEILARSWPTTSPQAAAAENGLTRIITPGTAQESTGMVVTSASSSPGQSTYGYSADYQSLRGRLEYSQASRQWKLRYIPIDGKTDQYGGSVVLPPSAQLEGYQPGDFVVVDGSPAAGAGGSRGFSPVYDVRRIGRTTR